MSVHTLIEALRGRSVAVYGLGREGRSSLHFLRRHEETLGLKRLILADRAPLKAEDPLRPLLDRDDVVGSFGEDQRDALRLADLVLMSPGIPWTDQTITREKDGFRLGDFPDTVITCQMDLFLRHAPGRIFGVTGTKGKSTTTSVLAAYLRELPRRSFLAGNIGVPVWDILEDLDDDAVTAVEMSSHQLQFCLAGPDTLILTNFYPEHLDHYPSYDDYVGAKLHALSAGAGDGKGGSGAPQTLILNLADDDLVRRALETAAPERTALVPVEDAGHGAAKVPGDRIRRFMEDPRAEAFTLRPGYLMVDDRYLTSAETGERLLDLMENPHLIGRHLRYDALLAAAALLDRGIDAEALRPGLRAYEGLPHRTQYVGTYRGIRFFNDSIATIPQATCLAVEALGEDVETLILGGMDRGLHFEAILDALLETKIRTLLLMPDTGAIIHATLEAWRTSDDARRREGARRVDAVMCRTMEDTVRAAYARTSPGKICLLAPAASSYNTYKNFEERGLDYADWVKRLGTSDGGSA